MFIVFTSPYHLFIRYDGMSYSCAYLHYNYCENKDTRVEHLVGSRSQVVRLQESGIA